MRIQSLPFAPSFLSFQTRSYPDHIHQSKSFFFQISHPSQGLLFFPTSSTSEGFFFVISILFFINILHHFSINIFHHFSINFPDTFWEFQTVQTSNLGKKNQGLFHHFHSLLRYLEEFQNQTPRPFVSSWSPIFSRTSVACPATPLRGRCCVSCCSCRSCRRSCGGGWWWGWKAGGSTAGGWRFL